MFASECILCPTNGGRPLWWWWVVLRCSMCRDRNDYQPPRSSYVSNTAQF